MSMNSPASPLLDQIAAPNIDRCASPLAESITLTALLRAQKQVCFEAKKIIFCEEAPADSVLLLGSGTVRLYRFLPCGRRLISQFLSAGDIVGLSFDNHYPVTAECITSVTAYQLSQSVLLALCAHSHALQSDLVRALKAELTSQQEDHLPLMHQPAEARVARLLRMIAQRNGSECRQGGPIQLLMTRYDIADYLGLTNETVSRSFRRMKNNGVISEPSPNLIRIEDVDKFMRLAEGEH